MVDQPQYDINIFERNIVIFRLCCLFKVYCQWGTQLIDQPKPRPLCQLCVQGDKGGLQSDYQPVHASPLRVQPPSRPRAAPPSIQVIEVDGRHGAEDEPRSAKNGG
ncbi:hypothetical protein FGO68_gene10826 [Halteria grandinella]|uniref:Uncharacterized protein n=1 Tax=Halteria grandinella TaxID=5974 RepID=A0A8J8P2G8_HALGN|nr:hypothetical protein FGO68_gene10826 [Halteria grandinella]